MKKLIVTALVLLGIQLQAQNINPDLLQKIWKASWIAVPNETGLDYGVYSFQKEITLAEQPDSYIIHVSADNKYKLYVNDQLVSAGPAVGDINQWRFETMDIAPFLHSGTNTIASIVWNDGKYKALKQISSRTAFIVQGDTKKENGINTNKSWKSKKLKAYQALEQRVNGYYALGPGECVDMNLLATDLGKSDWQESEMLGMGMPKGGSSLLPGGDWMLVPSSLPPMEMKEQRILKTRVTKGVSVPRSFPEKKSDVTIPANTSATILLDQTYLTNAYPTLIYSKGKNASVTIKYAEGLYTAEGKKDNRNEIEGKTLIGRSDSIICNGLESQNYTPLAWRTYRYVQLSIQTKEEPLIINDIYGTFTGYPFENNATLLSDNPLLSKILEIGWRTARLCAVETYVDCPYYEQLQYFGDTRIQTMVSYYNSGDDRLARNAIDLADDSRLPEGVTYSRYPSAKLQIIPPYSLFWIGMIHDFYRYRSDSDYVKSKLQGARQVLEFFAKYQQADGSVSDSPYWNFTDWAEGSPRAWKAGTPPKDDNGNSATLDLQLLWAYQIAAEMENGIGDKYFADKYSKQAEILKETIKAKYWDAEKKMFSDNSEKKVFSQHANSLAILTGCVAEQAAADLYNQIVKDPDMIKASIYFQYYLNMAMSKAGLGNNYLNQLGIWENNIAMGMTTWGEDSDVAGTRSDCHAWGASPNIEFYRIVLGIDSDAPGFAKVKIEPHLGDLKKISGSIPHPSGEIAVSYVLNKKNWNIAISLPQNTTGTLVWKGKAYDLQAGKNTFEIKD